jgi:heme-degrading monooxygenase HmoA
MTAPPYDGEERRVFSVIFEVCPKPDEFDEYLGLAKHLRTILERIDGFVDNERFESQLRPGWILSHSTWRDEKSLVRWRTVGEHHSIQERGRQHVLDDYHLRVGDVTADTDGPVHEQRFDTTETGTAKVATLTEITPPAGVDLANGADLTPLVGLDPANPGVVDHDVFASIYNPGKLAMLVSWTDADAAGRWSPAPPSPNSVLRHRVVRIVRDYGMFDRREAPQFYPDATGRETTHAQPTR